MVKIKQQMPDATTFMRFVFAFTYSNASIINPATNNRNIMPHKQYSYAQNKI